MAAVQVEQSPLAESAPDLWNFDIVQQLEQRNALPIGGAQNIDDVLNFCRRNSIDLAAFVHSAWALVLRRYLNTEQITFGSAVDGESAKLFQYIINEEATVLDFLKGVQPKVETNRAALSTSEDPLLNSCLVLKSGSSGTLDLPETSLTGTSMALVVQVWNNSLNVAINHKKESLPEVQALNIGSTFCRTLSTIIEDPNKPIMDLDLTSDRDLATIWKWNAAAPSKVRECVQEYIKRQVQRQPDSPAIFAWDASMTYRQLDDLSTRLAHHLFEKGAGPEVVVPLSFEKSAWAIVSFLAVVKAGAAVVFIDPSHPVARRQEIISQVGAKMVVTTPKQFAQWEQSGLDIITVEADFIHSLPSHKDDPVTGVHPENILYVIFTSGSTGVPKGCVIEHASFCSGALAQAIAGNITSTSRILQLASYSFDVSVLEILTALMHGACICTPNEASMMEGVAALINKFEITWAFLTPSLVKTVSPAEVPGLKTLILGGEALSKSDIKTWADHVQLGNGYGPSECSVAAAGNPNLSRTSHPANIGRAVGGLCWIVDPENHNMIVPIGAVGELLIDGPIVARGYLNNPVKTAEAFVESPSWSPHTSSGAPRRLYKTGDLARYNPDGTIHFIGRKDTQVKLRGLRIELGEIEHHIAVHDLTQHAVVLLPKTGRFAQRLVTVLSLKEHLTDRNDSSIHLASEELKPVTDEKVGKIRENLAGLVPYYMVPEAWIVLDSIPLLLSGKMARKDIFKWVTEMDEETYTRVVGVEGEDSGEALSHNESQLREVYSEVLNLDVKLIPLDRSFLSLGGDSISAMQVMSRCRARGMKVNVRDIITQKSIKGLALCVVDASESIYNMEETFDTPFELSPVQRMYFEVTKSDEKSTAHYNQSFHLRLTRHQTVETLENAMKQVVTQHSMLRSRMSQAQDGTWQQLMLKEVDGTYDFKVHNVESLEETSSLIASAQASLSLFTGPVFAAHVFDIQRDESQILFLVAHHAIIDLVSWRVIMRDLEEAILTGKITSMKPLPYQTWLELQSENAREFGNPKSVLPFEVPPPDADYWGMSGQPNKIKDTREEFSKLDPAVTSNLMGTLSHAALQTEPIDLIMSILMYSFSQSFADRLPPTIFREGHGREPWSDEIDISETVGWFTTMFPLSVDAAAKDDIIEFTRQVKDNRRAIPFNGRPYFASRFLNEEGKKAFGQHTQVEICFDYLGLYQQLERPDALLRQEPRTITPETSDVGQDVQRFSLFEITAEMIAGQMQFTFAYNTNMKHQDRIQKWIADLPGFFENALKVLAETTRQFTKSDFPRLATDYSSLNKLLSEKLPEIGVHDADEVEDVYPCSDMQQGMLISQNRGSGFYEYRQPFEIASKNGKPIDVPRLKTAWQKVIQRHSILRTVFIESVGGFGVFDQLVLKESSGRISIFTGDRQEADEAFSKQTPIRFTDSEPPHRFSICALKDGAAYCQLELNHAIIDGGSMPMVMQDLVLAYDGLLSDKPAPLFGDYISYINNVPKETAIEHWKQLLADLEPTYFPALEASEKNAELKEIEVDLPVTASELQSFCASHEITLSNVFQVAWAMVLGSYLNSDDICFGYLSSGREAPVQGIETAVGPFITMLVCRLGLSNKSKISELLATAQDNFLQSLPHQHCSLADIQHALHLSGQPLFNSVMSFQKDVTSDALKDSSVSINAFQNHDPSEYSVTVDFMVTDKDVSTKLGYWTSSISDSHANFLANTLSKAVSCVLRSADSLLGEVDLLSEKHMSQILDWNAERPEEVFRCVHEIFEEQVAMQPNAPAVSSFDGNFTYAELDQLTTNFAHYLVGLGVGPEVLVPISFPKSAWTIVTMIAVLKAGGASVPLDSTQPIARLETMVGTIGAKLVLVAPQNAKVLGSIAENVVAVDENLIRGLPSVHQRACTTVRPNNAVHVVFTSGTTGVPKGIVLQHANIATYAKRMMALVQVGPGKRVLQFASYTFDVSISDIYGALMVGACICNLSDYDRMNNLVGAIQSLKPTYADLTSTVACMINPADAPSFETLAIGGEPLKQELLDLWAGKVTIFNVYGPAECSVTATYNRVGSRDTTAPTTNNIGTAMSSLLWIANPGNHNQLVPIGCVGELLIEGPLVAREYLRDPEKTAKSFIKNPAWAQQVPGEDRKFYKTGDLVRYNNDGSLHLIGRADTQVKINGQRLELGDIETHVTNFLPHLKQVSAEAVTLQGSNRKSLAVFFLADASEADQKSDDLAAPLTNLLREQLQGLQSSLSLSLPSYMVPSSYIAMKRMPMNASGKLNRSTLRQLATGLSERQQLHYALEDGEKQQPSTAMEKQLQALWSDTLGIPQSRIGATDSFFRLGGDSVVAMRLVAAARAANLVLSVTNIFKHPELCNMAIAAENETSNAPSREAVAPFQLLRGFGPLQDILEQAATQCNVSKSAIRDVYPCTPLQEALLALSIKQHGAYVGRKVFSIPAGFDLEMFREAWNKAIVAEEILRTRIIQTDSGSLQVVLAEESLWRTGETLEKYLASDEQTPFAYGEPLSRIAIVQKAGGNASFVWTAHHAVYDGWSQENLFERIQLLFAGQTIAPSPAFKGFVKYLLDTDLDASNTFWRSQLVSQEEPTHFPKLPHELYKPRTDQQYIHKANLSRKNKSHITNATMMKAAWAKLISRYSDSDDVIFALTDSGRAAPVAGIEGMTGPTITTVPLRVRLDVEGMSVAQYLENVQSQYVEMTPYAHRGLQNLRNLSPEVRAVLDLKHLFVFQPSSSATPEFLGFTPLPNDETDFNTYALVVEASWSGDNVIVNVQYDETVIDTLQVQRMLFQYEHVIRQLNEESTDLKVVDIEIFSPQDCQEVLSWNGERHETMEFSLTELISQNAPDACAVSSWDVDLSYRQLELLSNRLAAHLAELGAGKTSFMVPLCINKSAWSIVSALAVLKTGAAYVSVSPSYPIDRLRGIVKDVEASIVLASPEHASLFDGIVSTVLHVDESWLTSLPNPITPFQSRARAEDPAFVVFTSGSTGKPKGIVIEHRTMVSMSYAIAPTMHFDNKTRVLHFASLIFDVSNMEVLTTLVFGGCICVPTEHERMNDLAGVINRKEANWLFLTPAMADILDPDTVPTLKTLVFGGEAMRPDMQQKLAHKIHLINGYGPSEATIFASNSHMLPHMKISNIGKGYGANLWIAEPDNSNRLTAIGCVGEILIDGPIVSSGYINEPEKTAAAFILGPDWSHDGTSPRRMYKTGDLARYNSDGTLDIVGRKDTQVKLRGHRIELEEVEAQGRILLPDAQHVVADVVLREGRTGDKVLALFVELAHITTDETLLSMTEELQTQLSQVQLSMIDVLPAYMVPSLFVPFSKFPKTASGKLDRKEIRNVASKLSREQLESFALSTATKRAPSTDAEKRLQAIFAETLNIPIDSIGADDSFFLLGGDSIKVMRLTAACRKQDMALSVADAFRHPRLSAMAQAVRDLTDANSVDRVEPFALLKSPVKQAVAAAATLCEVSPESIEDMYPCTPLQEGLMDITVRNEGSYLAQQVFKLPDAFDVVRFKEAWQKLHNIHPILRTRIVENSLQVVVREQMTWQEASSLEEYLASDMATGIQLGKPLARYAIVENHFIWTAHHAIYDGWSRNTLYSQLQTLYDGHDIPEPTPYANFINRLENVSVDESNAFWQAQLSGDMATSFPDRLSLDSSPGPDQRLLYTFAVNQNKSGFLQSTVLRAAWAMIVAKHSNADDVIFAMTLSGRDVDMDGIENVMGPTITTVPMRMRLNMDMAIPDWLKECETQTVEMIPFAHAGLQNIQGSGNKIDLRHLFVIQTAEETPSTALGMQPVERDVAGFDSYDLVIECAQGSDKVEIDVRFNSTVIPPEGMQRMLHQFEHAVKQLNGSLHQAKLSEIEIFSPQDLADVERWNSNQPTAIDNCVHQLIKAQAFCRPDAEAIVAWDGDFTYRQLDNFSSQLAHHLIKLGVGPEVMVPICLDKSGWTIVAMLAVLKAGGACVPLNPEHPPSRLNQIAENVDAIVILAGPQYTEFFADAKATAVSPDMDLLKEYPITGAFNTAAPSNPGFVVFTSGSTGAPKGIVIEHRALCSSAFAHGPAFTLGPGSRILQFAAYTFDVSIGEMFTTLMLGGTICVPSEYERMNELAAFIRRTKVNWTFLTPTVASLLDPNEVPSLKTLALGGEAMTRENISSWAEKVNLINTYGPAETTIWSTMFCGVQPGHTPANLGHGCGGIMWIADVANHDKLTPVGCVGELLIEGPILARGYVKLEEKTKAAFITNPAWARGGNTERRFYKTGDLVRYNHRDGSIEYVARKDTQIKLHGQRIEVAEIEHHLSIDSRIRHSIIMLPRAGFADQRLTAVLSLESIPVPTVHTQPELVVTETVKAEVASIRKALSEKVPNYMVPSVWLVVDDIAMTVSGKLNRLETKKWLEGMAQEPFVLEDFHLDGSQIPTTDMEAKIQTILSKILNIPIILLSNSFLGLGGDSITAMQLRTRARAVGISVSIQDIMRSKTIFALAQSATFLNGEASIEEEIFDTPFEPSPIQQLYFDVETNSAAQFNQSFLLRVSKVLPPADVANALENIVNQHSMLRARFSKTEDGKWMQYVPKQVAGSYSFETIELPSRQDLMPFIHKAQKTLDILDGPVFSASLINIAGSAKQMLFVCAHHLIIDLVSWRIILQDLEQILETGALSTPKSISFQNWCKALTNYSAQQGPQKALPIETRPANFEYWGMEKRENTFSDLKQESFVLDQEMTAKVFGISNQALRTEPLEIILAACGHSFAQVFHDRTTPTIFNEGHGRESWSTEIDPSNIVGWFTTMTPLHVPAEKDALGMLIRTKDLLRKVPGKGLPYFASRYLSSAGQQAFGDHRRMEIVFNYQGRYQQLEKQDALFQPEQLDSGESLSDIGSATQRMSLFDVGADVSDGLLRVSIAYNKQMNHQDRISSWVSTFKQSIEHLAERLAITEASHTLSDFQLLNLDYKKLDILHNRLEQLDISPSQVEDILPTAPMQQSMLAAQRKVPGTYEVQSVYEIVAGAIDIGRLRNAWQTVTNRHGTLRTIFVPSISGYSFDQVVLETCVARFNCIQCEGSQLAQRAAVHPAIDYLEFRPHNRLTVFRSEDKTMCKFEINHALMDGLSMRLILRDLALAYEQKPFDTPAGRLSDYISFLQKQPLGEGVDYWTSFLKAVEPCQFPSSTELPLGAVKQQKAIPIKLSQDFNAIQTFSKSHNITVANVFQVAWALVLRHYCGSNNVNYGCLTSGRDVPVENISDLVGPVIQMLVCRQIVGNSTTVVDLLHSNQDDFLQSLPYQYGLIDAVRQSGRSERELFNTIMSLQYTGDVETDDSTPAIDFVHIDGSDPNQFDVSIGVAIGAGAVEVQMGYWTTFTSDTDAEAIAMTFTRAVEAIVCGATENVKQLEL